MTVGNQLIALVLFILIGFASGFIFDFYHTFKKFFKFTPWLQVVLDFCLWVFITIICAFLLVLVNWGEVRFYVFLAMGSGLIIYYFVLSRTVKKIYGFIIGRTLWLMKLLIRYVVKIFKFFFRTVGRILEKILLPVSRRIEKGKRKIRKISRPLGKILNKVDHKRRIL